MPSQHDGWRGLELATLIGWYWITRATSEGIRWIDALLAIGGGDPQADALTHFLRGHLAVLQSDPAAAAPVPSRSSRIEPAGAEHEPEHPTRVPDEERRF